MDITDQNQQVVNSYSYDSFGIPQSWNESISNPYTYTSREYNPESDNYYYRARTYYPTIGRFGSEDPIGFAAGINFYTYVNNNPVLFTDPYGKYVLMCHRPIKNTPLNVGKYVHHTYLVVNNTDYGFGPSNKAPWGKTYTGVENIDKNIKKGRCMLIFEDNCRDKCVKDLAKNLKRTYTGVYSCHTWALEIIARCAGK